MLRLSEMLEGESGMQGGNEKKFGGAIPVASFVEARN